MYFPFSTNETCTLHRQIAHILQLIRSVAIPSTSENKFALQNKIKSNRKNTASRGKFSLSLVLYECNRNILFNLTKHVAQIQKQYQKYRKTNNNNRRWNFVFYTAIVLPSICHCFVWLESWSRDVVILPSTEINTNTYIWDNI